jgi:hypothetical protein
VLPESLVLRASEKQTTERSIFAGIRRIVVRFSLVFCSQQEKYISEKVAFDP